MMSSRGSCRAPYKLLSFLELFRGYYTNNIIASHKSCCYPPGGNYPTQTNMQLINYGTWRKLDRHHTPKTTGKTDKEINARLTPAIPPRPPPTKSFNFSFWRGTIRWILGSVLVFLLPSLKPKWEKLKRIEGEVEMVVEEAEHVAEVVEKVAAVAEKVSADVAENLPEHTKLKTIALTTQHISQIAAHDAHCTQNFFHKVDELKQNLEDLDAMVEPVVNKIVEHVEGKS
ncbi:uncharacterized protein LOC110816073 [Carica papaya]|uniref:uncharacterized protein LOC110816073 n=1 Tax=Carica papaya TaxID=3649 RepID=UPI000B8CF148|nr:uncharacterized protein LOC110816073 [Carica papaya]